MTFSFENTVAILSGLVRDRSCKPKYESYLLMTRIIENIGWYRLHANLLPQPLAFIVGRIARAEHLAEQVDCLRRAAETLTRYLAITQVCSLPYSDNDEELALKKTNPTENFSWGWYINVLRKMSKFEGSHPLKSFISKGMGEKSSGKKEVPIELPAIAKLESLNATRNSVTDHSLVGMDDHKAMQLLEEWHLEEYFRESIEAFKPLLDLPLIVVSDRKYVKVEKGDRYRVLHYKGENDPFPLEIRGQGGLVEQDIPYIVYGQRLIPLSPGMVVDSWAPHRKGLYFIDGIKSERPQYRTIFNDELKYRGDCGGWPHLEWCAPEDYEQIVTSTDKNLRGVLDDKFKDAHNGIISEVSG